VHWLNLKYVLLVCSAQTSCRQSVLFGQPHSASEFQGISALAAFPFDGYNAQFGCSASPETVSQNQDGREWRGVLDYGRWRRYGRRERLAACSSHGPHSERLMILVYVVYV
jgi:hypothetical protein